jgi:molybdopterin molybdotransferase
MATGGVMAEPFGREGLSLDEALARILAGLQPLGRAESLPLPEACGRITAEAVHAAEAVPGFRASIMDGYAIAAAAAASAPQPGARWRLVGVSAAGAPHPAALAAGEAVRIVTGAMVPEGGDRVLPQELTTLQDEQLLLAQPCGSSSWIRQPDEEAAPAQLLVPAGHRLGVADLGRLASCGVQRVQVSCRPRLGLLISGDELQAPGLARAPGQIWESNSTLLQALLQRLGTPIAALRMAPDQPEPLRQALRELAAECDVVVSSGGVSAGDSDWIRPLVAELGQVNFWKLFLKPGRPFAYGELAGVPFFGLPGNPVAAAVTALQLLWPALQRLEGGEPERLPRLRVRLEQPVRRTAGRPELARARLVVAADGGLWARIEGSQASSRIGSLQGADLLLEIPAELADLQAGCELWAQLLRLAVL